MQSVDTGESDVKVGAPRGRWRLSLMDLEEGLGWEAEASGGRGMRGVREGEGRLEGCLPPSLPPSFPPSLHHNNFDRESVGP